MLRMITLKTPLGEAPESIPTAKDVRHGWREPAAGLDGGTVDRILRRFGGRVHVCRAHCSAQSNGHRNRNDNCCYSELEEVVGLSRTFRVELEQACSVPDLLDALRQAQVVESASACYLCVTETATQQQTEPNEQLAWSSRDAVGLQEALAIEPGDPSVVVAVVDTGVKTDHRELWQQTGPGFDTVQLTSRNVGVGLELLGDVNDPDSDPDDEVGHGTSCAGIIAAKGEKIPPGAGGRCRLMPVRVLGAARLPGKDQPVGLGSIIDIDEGIARAIALGAKVINMSLGTPVASLMPEDEIPHSDVIRYGLERGCIFIAASGNSGTQEDYTPACLEGVIAVGSVDADGRPSAFTTTGPHVALCAQGREIVSTGHDGGYCVQNGTSFAAPFVAGTAALLVSRALRNSLPLDGTAVRHFLAESARPHSRLNKTGYGSGILNACDAIKSFDRWLAQHNRQPELQTATI